MLGRTCVQSVEAAKSKHERVNNPTLCNPFGIQIFRTPNTEIHSKVLLMTRDNGIHYSPMLNILSKHPLGDQKRIISLIERHQLNSKTHPLHYQLYSIMRQEDGTPQFIRRYSSLTGKSEDINGQSGEKIKNLMVLGMDMITMHTGFHPKCYEEGIKHLLFTIAKETVSVLEGKVPQKEEFVRAAIRTS